MLTDNDCSREGLTSQLVSLESVGTQLVSQCPADCPEWQSCCVLSVECGAARLG